MEQEDQRVQGAREVKPVEWWGSWRGKPPQRTTGSSETCGLWGDARVCNLTKDKQSEGGRMSSTKLEFRSVDWDWRPTLWLTSWYLDFPRGISKMVLGTGNRQDTILYHGGMGSVVRIIHADTKVVLVMKQLIGLFSWCITSTSHQHQDHGPHR